MSAFPVLPERLTLPALQSYVREMVAVREFTTDRNEIFILLVEEVGELAAEFKNREFYPDRYDPINFAHELADILMYLADLANGFGLDLMNWWSGHERENDRRFADRRGGRPPDSSIDRCFTLAQLAAHLEAKRQERQFQDSPHTLMILLTEELGEVATELRKSWRGGAEPSRMAHEIIDALTYLLRIANWFEVDLEAAVREKERRNALRTWNT